MIALTVTTRSQAADALHTYTLSGLSAADCADTIRTVVGAAGFDIVCATVALPTGRTFTGSGIAGALALASNVAA
jgi:hypothetical protein